MAQMHLTNRCQPSGTDISQRPVPLARLTQEALMRASFIKEAAWQIHSILQTDDLPMAPSALQEASAASWAIYSEMDEFEATVHPN